MLDHFLLDIQYGIRMLARKPGLTLGMILILALGIGANSAIFSVVDAVLFRPVAAFDSDRLVRIFASDAQGNDLNNASYPVYLDYRDGSKSFQGIAAYANDIALDCAFQQKKPERVMGALASGNFFEVLGVTPAHGRLFNANDDHGAPVVVLSHSFWQRQLQSNPAAVGTAIRINGAAFTVVGIAPPGFFGPGLDAVPEMWVPIGQHDLAMPEFAGSRDDRRFGWASMIARLKPGVTLEQAQAELRAFAAARAARQPDGHKDSSASLLPAHDGATQWDLTPVATNVSWMLLGVVLLVLLIACSVTAGLMLLRAEQRRREISVRLALGAPRSRILRLVFVESLLIAGLSAVIGVLFAAWTSDLLVLSAPGAFPFPLDAATPILNSRVLLFTIAIAFFSALLFGMIPAFRASGFDVISAIKGEHFVPGSSKITLQNVFVVAQVAISTILLAGAGLLLRTLWNAYDVHPGFRVDHGMVASLNVAKQGYTEETGRQFYAELLERIRTNPAVSHAAMGRTTPIQNSGMRVSVEINGYTPGAEEDMHVAFNIITPGFFEAMGVQLQYGREFQESDKSESPMVAIISSAMAEKFWRGRNPVGSTLVAPGRKSAMIVGVARDVRYTSLREAPVPMLYLAHAQFYMPSMTLVIRTRTEPQSFNRDLTKIVASFNSDLPLYGVSTLEEKLAMSLGQERLVAALVSAFALLALFLAAAGLYSVISYATELRMREFGIRLALGATQEKLFALVLSRGAILTAAGLLFGCSAALAGARWIESLLFGITPADPATYVTILLVLSASSLLAAALPARRAARVKPADALRNE